MPRVPAVSIMLGVILLLASACSPVPSWNPPQKAHDDKSMEMSLWEAARGCDPLSLSALIRAGANVNAAKGLKATTALMEATKSYGPECPVNNMRILMERGATIALVDADGNTALHHLAATECTTAYDQATLMLLKAGADPLAKNKAGQDPITLAAQRGCNTRVALMAEMVAAKRSQHLRPGGPKLPPGTKPPAAGATPAAPAPAANPPAAAATPTPAPAAPNP